MRVAIVGLGLIGGSLALALRRGQPSISLLGVDLDEETRRLAMAAGAVDDSRALGAAPLDTCDVVVLAVPGPALLTLVEPIAARLRPGAVLTDVGGAKGPIMAAAAAQGAAVFVGGHPMAGTEFRGFGAAFATLFDGCTVALCDPVGGPPGAAAGGRGQAALALVKSLWQSAGAGRLLTVLPEEHDRAVTFASHLPYLAAAAVAEALLGSGPSAQLARDLAAGGFRDTTRLAGDGTLAGAASQNHFLPGAARALSEVLRSWADRLERDTAGMVTELGRLADERRGMKLPPRK
jgi:prephenate dehydrogenase